MGHRTHLYLANTKEVLFGANNNLPFFWITLMDKESLVPSISLWNSIHDLSIDENLSEEQIEEEIDILNGEKYYNVNIQRDKYFKNLTNSKDYIGKIYPELLPSYIEFTSFITKYFSQESNLVINCFSLSDFNGIPEFIQELLKELECIKNYRRATNVFLDENNPIDSTIGGEMSLDGLFMQDSIIYKEHILDYRKKNLEKQARQLKKPNNDKRQSQSKLSEIPKGYLIIYIPLIILLTILLLKQCVF